MILQSRRQGGENDVALTHGDKAISPGDERDRCRVRIKWQSFSVANSSSLSACRPRYQVRIDKTFDVLTSVTTVVLLSSNRKGDFNN